MAAIPVTTRARAGSDRLWPAVTVSAVAHAALIVWVARAGARAGDRPRPEAHRREARPARRRSRRSSTSRARRRAAAPRAGPRGADARRRTRAGRARRPHRGDREGRPEARPAEGAEPEPGQGDRRLARVGALEGARVGGEGRAAVGRPRRRSARRLRGRARRATGTSRSSTGSSTRTTTCPATISERERLLPQGAPSSSASSPTAGSPAGSFEAPLGERRLRRRRSSGRCAQTRVPPPPRRRCARPTAATASGDLPDPDDRDHDPRTHPRARRSLAAALPALAAGAPDLVDRLAELPAAPHRRRAVPGRGRRRPRRRGHGGRPRRPRALRPLRRARPARLPRRSVGGAAPRRRSASRAGRTSGAEGLVQGARAPAGGELEGELHLYEVRAGREVLVKRLRAPAAEPRALGHRIADEIVRYYTREPGVFSTQHRRHPQGARAVRARPVRRGRQEPARPPLRADDPAHAVVAAGRRRRSSLTSYRSGRPELWALRARRHGASAGSPPSRTRWAASTRRTAAGSRSPSTEGGEQRRVGDERGRLRRAAAHPRARARPLARRGRPTASGIAFVSDRGRHAAALRHGRGRLGPAPAHLPGQLQPDAALEPARRPRSPSPRATSARCSTCSSSRPTRGKIDRVTQDQGRTNEEPTWAPNGRLMAFRTDRTGAGPSSSCRIAKGERQTVVAGGGGRALRAGVGPARRVVTRPWPSASRRSTSGRTPSSSLVAERRGATLAPGRSSGPRSRGSGAASTRAGGSIRRRSATRSRCSPRTPPRRARSAREIVACVATSAARDAANGAEFFEAARAAAGLAPGGDLGRRGGAARLRERVARLRRRGRPLAVLDVGGGSTEFIRRATGRRRAAARACRSARSGSPSATSAAIRRRRPSSRRSGAPRREALRPLAAIAAPVGPARLVGVAGTVTTLAAVAQALPAYDAERVHGATLTLAAVERARRRASPRSPSRERAALPGMEPKRADVILAGAIIVVEAMRAAGFDRLTVSDRGVRWGLLHDRVAPGMSGLRALAGRALRRRSRSAARRRSTSSSPTTRPGARTAATMAALVAGPRVLDLGVGPGHERARDGARGPGAAATSASTSPRPMLRRARAPRPRGAASPCRSSAPTRCALPVRERRVRRRHRPQLPVPPRRRRRGARARCAACCARAGASPSSSRAPGGARLARGAARRPAPRASRWRSGAACPASTGASTRRRSTALLARAGFVEARAPGPCSPASG